MNLARSSFYLTATNIGLVGLTALNFFFLTATLSPKQLGILSILLTISALGLNLLSAGYNKAAIYYVGRKTFALETVITNGLIICFLLGILLGGALIGFGSYLGLLFPDIPVKLLYLAVMSTPIQIFLYYLAESCLAAELLAVSISIRVIPPVVYVLGCVLAAAWGILSADSAFVVYVLGMFLADLLGLGLVVFKSKSHHLFKPNLPAAKSCLSFGRKALVGELAHFLAVRLDLILVGLWAGMEASGYYSVAARLAETIWLVAYSAQQALAAKVAQGFADSLNIKAIRLERTVRYMATGSFLVGLGVISVSFVVFKFLLVTYEPTFYLLLALTPGQVALAIFLLLIANLIGDGHPMLATKLRVALFTLSLICYLTLIPMMGALGAGLATSIAYTISTVIAAVMLGKMYQIKLSDFFVWKKEDREIIRALLNSRNIVRPY
jgi:O-antigen/teichoic acid export membrane protein